jgi:hypothetical protein
VRACCPGWGGTHCTDSKYLSGDHEQDLPGSWQEWGDSICDGEEVAGCLGTGAGQTDHSRTIALLTIWVCLIFSSTHHSPC